MNLLSIALEYIQKHSPEDNGNIESFHNSLKTDYIWPFEFSDYSEASVAIEKLSRTTMSLGHTPQSIIFLQGNSGGGSRRISRSGRNT